MMEAPAILPHLRPVLIFVHPLSIDQSIIYLPPACIMLRSALELLPSRLSALGALPLRAPLPPSKAKPNNRDKGIS